MMRVHFAEQLDLLNSELSRMGGLCEEAIMKSANALIRQDPFLAHEVSYLAGEIDEKENQIVGLCYKLLLQQQPVASDLRLISAAMKMVTDMEESVPRRVILLRLSEARRCSGLNLAWDIFGRWRMRRSIWSMAR